MQKKRSRNKIKIKGDVAEITLHCRDHNERALAIIDSEDVSKIKDYRWCVSLGRNAIPAKVVGRTKGYERQITIQHIIMGRKPSRHTMIDHKNRNPLDNRKYNLRLCTNTENCRNSKGWDNSKSGCKGVKKRGNSWGARIMVNRKEIWLGSFKSQEEAKLAYINAAVKHFGEFAMVEI